MGVLVWFATLESGVHATLAGVALGLLTPARPVGGREVLNDLVHSLHPVSAFLIVPVFALANAGVDLRGGALGDAFGQSVTWAVAVGLVAGKIVGIGGVAHPVRRLGWGTLPGDMHRREILGAAALGGIGFTVSLFITDLAFTDAALIGQAKVGILAASAVSAVLGAVLLLTAPTGATGAALPPGARRETGPAPGDRTENRHREERGLQTGHLDRTGEPGTARGSAPLQWPPGRPGPAPAAHRRPP